MSLSMPYRYVVSIYYGYIFVNLPVVFLCIVIIGMQQIDLFLATAKSLS